MRGLSFALGKLEMPIQHPGANVPSAGVLSGPSLTSLHLGRLGPRLVVSLGPACKLVAIKAQGTNSGYVPLSFSEKNLLKHVGNQSKKCLPAPTLRVINMCQLYAGIVPGAEERPRLHG